jgi:hypothetical protein
MNTVFKLENIKNASGSQGIVKYPLKPQIVYTSGIRSFIEKFECNWLIYEIAFVLFPILRRNHLDYFYSIELLTHLDNSVMLKVGDGNGNIHFVNKISNVHFPVKEMLVKIYLCESDKCFCLMLPSEY